MAGTVFDPNLIDHLVEVAKEIRKDNAQDYEVEIECHPKDLIPRMILSRDLISGTGMLLL